MQQGLRRVGGYLRRHRRSGERLSCRDRDRAGVAMRTGISGGRGLLCGRGRSGECVPPAIRKRMGVRARIPARGRSMPTHKDAETRIPQFARRRLAVRERIRPDGRLLRGDRASGERSPRLFRKRLGMRSPLCEAERGVPPTVKHRPASAVTARDVFSTSPENGALRPTGYRRSRRPSSDRSIVCRKPGRW